MSYARYLMETYLAIDEEALEESLINQCIDENYDLLLQMDEEEMQEFVGKWIQAARNKLNNSRLGAGINKLSGDGINYKSTKQRNTEADFYGSLKNALADKRFPSARKARQLDGQTVLGKKNNDEPVFDAGKSTRHYIAGVKSAQARAKKIAAQRQGWFAAQQAPIGSRVARLASKKPLIDAEYRTLGPAQEGLANKLFEQYIAAR